jgi:hypothetical protein
VESRSKLPKPELLKLEREILANGSILRQNKCRGAKLCSALLIADLSLIFNEKLRDSIRGKCSKM